MLKMFLSLMVIFLSIIMFFTNHPITMGIFILSQTLIICLILGTLSQSYWFSYILFLVFLGGLLVLFIYISSIASNEPLNSHFTNTFIFLSPLIFIFISFFYKTNLNWLNFSFNEDMNKFFNLFFFYENEPYISLLKLYNEQTYLSLFMMIIYLFITLIMVVKITNIFLGPLRSSN